MRILFVDDDLKRHERFEKALFGFYSCLVQAYDVEEAFSLIKADEPFNIICFDHDMGPGKDDTGYALVKRLCDDNECVEKMKTARIFIHSFNTGGALNMSAYLKHFGLSAELIEFGKRLMKKIEEIRCSD